MHEEVQRSVSSCVGMTILGRQMRELFPLHLRIHTTVIVPAGKETFVLKNDFFHFAAAVSLVAALDGDPEAGHATGSYLVQ